MVHCNKLLEFPKNVMANRPALSYWMELANLDYFFHLSNDNSMILYAKCNIACFMTGDDVEPRLSFMD